MYVIFHKKEGRWQANLVNFNTGHRTTLSYARYLMSVHLGRLLTKEEQVDHINNDKSDDSFENLQILTPKENRKKRDLIIKEAYREFICPICNKNFKLTKRQSHRKNPCCSKVCGYLKMKTTLKSRADNSMV